ncbi:hypothetical protein COU20_01585 [Candidatus Kaiserbacteria bacterium CG10_big_fil_rev_8_21_14_0_10_59_10]|uniref:PEGA domain-containing protein n=1 Tax=Candidatus Kaiserbacteria bacterium CG10_big_fil_rev_8_21_14_0_10_59_10 TaxID=1974612 RepID=A0A2H0U839_9BACT|nr:MAG: hypothetical protein COU20_01585 [Candidatus Kaiserbacteria bacterium CG10_big_fil_rev_8_21_14_0_10_59_10]
MEPLSRSKRTAYLSIFAFLFCAIVPVVLLYAGGYRFHLGEGFVQTGGLYLEVPYAGARVTVNGSFVGETNFLTRSYYIGDLTAGSHSVHVSKDGFLPWHRALEVEPRLVTSAHVLLVPDDALIEEVVLEGEEEDGEAGGRYRVSDELYASIVDAFERTQPISAGGTVDVEGNLALVLSDGDVTAHWLLADAPPPSYFCRSPSHCTRRIALESGPETSVNAAFWMGGALYLREDGGLMFTEIDARPTPVSALLYRARGAEFRIVAGELFVKDNGRIVRVGF